MINLFVNNKIYNFASIESLDSDGVPSNPKPVFIVLAKDERLHLSFLDKILNAIGMDRTNDVMTFLHDKASVPIHNRVSQMDDAKVLIFGIRPTELGINFSYKEYEPILFDNTEYLFSGSLEDLQSDKRKKLALWNALQIMFPKNKRE